MATPRNSPMATLREGTPSERKPEPEPEPKPIYYGDWIYDVFLSFRGEDTRYGFTSHLFSALSRAGILTFMDKSLERGKEIQNSLLEAIECSKSYIIVFSPNYAGSRWCMKELEKIVETRILYNQRILSVFYHVDPSDVRRQKGPFGKSFAILKKKISVWERESMNRWTVDSRDSATELAARWRRALDEVGNLSGWTVGSGDDESQIITEIVNSISTNAYKKNLFVADYPVDIGTRAREFISKLPNDAGPKGVFIAGLWGMGGSGKTSLASAIFNYLGGNFVRRSFIADVREAWEQGNGCHLQEQLVLDVLTDPNLKISSINWGKTIIQKRFCHVEALVVLDDVNDEDQLKALCGNRSWFGPSSIIIITTRDVDLLHKIDADYIHEMKVLDDSKSFELFSWHAFKQPNPTPDFVDLSRKVVTYCGGLPLALVILGSYLYKRLEPQWKDVLLKLTKIPNGKINEKLKVSFDGLRDHMEKDIFLHICCFFIGKKRDKVTIVLDGCGLHAEIGISVLMERSLVRVDRNNKLRMHDLLRDMGREVIREESPEKLGKRSRLWSPDDVINVLTGNTGTNKVKGLALTLTRTPEIPLPAKGFKKMNELRLLRLRHVKLSGNYDGLSENLKWLSWSGFPSSFPSENFYRGGLVGIDLKHSSLEVFWNMPQYLLQLKILNLSHSHYLMRTPDFGYMPELERLILKDCPRLSEVNETIGNLSKLRMVNLKGCESLQNLPRSFYCLKSLENLILSDCSKISELEQDIEQMDSLTTLVAENTAITEVPFSIVRLKSIKFISLCGYKGLVQDVFPSLISPGILPPNYLRSLSPAFGYKPCEASVRVQSNVFATKYLEMEPTTSGPQISDREASELSVSHNQIPNSSRLDNMLISILIEMGNCRILQEWTANQSDDSSFPWRHEWPSYSYKGQRVSFKMPQIDCNLEGMILSIDYSYSQDGMASPFPFSVLIHNNTKGNIKSFKQDAKAISDEAQWQDIVANLEAGDEVDINVVFGHRFNVKKTTVYLIYRDSIKKQHSSTADRDAVVSREEIKNECQNLVKINSTGGQLHNDEKEDFSFTTKKTFKKRRIFWPLKP